MRAAFVLGLSFLLPACLSRGPDRDDDSSPSAIEAVAPRADSRPLASPRADLPGLSNFAQVSPALYRSAQPTREGFERLKAMGVRTVVNLRNVASDRGEMAGLGLRYVHIHCVPWHPEDEDVVAFLQVVSDPANHPVLVHCRHGADRTGMMVAAYRAVVEGWPMDEAMQELPRFGFHRIWGGLKTYLENLDAVKLRAKAREAPPPEVETVP